MIYILLGLVLFWLICVVLAAGGLFAYAQDEFSAIAKEDYREDLGFAWGLSLLGGPGTLFVSIFATGFWKHGWRLR